MKRKKTRANRKTKTRSMKRFELVVLYCGFIAFAMDTYAVNSGKYTIKVVELNFRCQMMRMSLIMLITICFIFSIFQTEVSSMSSVTISLPSYKAVLVFLCS